MPDTLGPGLFFCQDVFAPFLFLREATAKRAGKKVCVVSAAPPCGIVWDPEKHVVKHEDGTALASEADSWKWFLAEADLQVIACIIEPQSEFGKTSAFAAGPVTVVVGPDGRVREICEGLGPRAREHLSKVVADLLEDAR